MKLEQVGQDLKKMYDFSTSEATMPLKNDDVDYTDYRFESARLDSFVNWPLTFIDPKKLAAAGFFYTKRDDEVRCFMCLIILSQWSEGDDPMVEHQRWSGKCLFVRNAPCGNVPIGADPTMSPKPKRLDTCGIYGVKYMPCSGPDNDLKTEEAVNPGLVHPEISNDVEITVFWDSHTNANFTAKLVDVLGSKEPTYASYERRLRSFAMWPERMCQSKEDMAAAGFFYHSGLFSSSDQTMCFYCGGCLKAWQPTDEPIKEHVKWFPECRFIQRLIEKQKLEEKGDLCTSSTKRVDNEICITNKTITTSVC